MKSVLARLGVFAGAVVLVVAGFAAPASASWGGTQISGTPINVLCIDVLDNHPGVSPRMSNCSSAPNQIWDIMSVPGDSSTYQIINESTHYCVTRSAEDTTSFLYMYFCSTDPHQRWKVTVFGPAPDKKISSAGNIGICLQNNGLGAELSMNTCPATKWIFIL